MMETPTEKTLSPQELDLIKRSHKTIKRNANGDPINHASETAQMEIESNTEGDKQQQEDDELAPYFLF